MTGRAAPRPKREKCGGPGAKDIYESKREAKDDLPSFRREHGGRGKVYQCSWAWHYHITKGYMGQRNPGRSQR